MSSLEEMVRKIEELRKELEELKELVYLLDDQSDWIKDEIEKLWAILRRLGYGGDKCG